MTLFTEVHRSAHCSFWMYNVLYNIQKHPGRFGTISLCQKRQHPPRSFVNYHEPHTFSARHVWASSGPSTILDLFEHPSGGEESSSTQLRNLLIRWGSKLSVCYCRIVDVHACILMLGIKGIVYPCEICHGLNTKEFI